MRPPIPFTIEINPDYSDNGRMIQGLAVKTKGNSCFSSKSVLKGTCTERQRLTERQRQTEIDKERKRHTQRQRLRDKDTGVSKEKVMAALC